MGVGFGGVVSDAFVDFLVYDMLQGVPDEDEVGVVGDVAAGGTEVDDWCGLWAVVGVGFDVGDDVVVGLLFVRSCRWKKVVWLDDWGPTMAPSTAPATLTSLRI